uniref:Uncharacterized protein n=4 Tax=unclassified bacterial viruses TaxID=12333 RepID=A0AAU6W2T5_9VIRU
MISRGKRKYIIRLVSSSIWNSMSPEEQKAANEAFVESAITQMCIGWRIPRAMLTGSDKQ